MKILQLVTKRQYRGAEVFAANLSKELIKLGHEIIFAGIYKNNEDILHVENAINLDIGESKGGKFSPTISLKIYRLIKEAKPDIIQCNGSDTLKYAISASLLLAKTPICYRNISTISEWIKAPIQLALYKLIFSKVDYVTSVGENARQDFIKTLQYPEKKTMVIRRGIPINEFDKQSSVNKLKMELSLSKEAIIVMHVGNFSPEKNHQFLLDIFSRIKSVNSRIKLVCVGTGLLFEHIQKKIKERDLDDTIFLLGFRKNVAELLAASDLCVLSSKIEGVPGVILEAASQKVPTISVNVGGVKEVLEDEVTGLIIDKYDARIFGDKILDLAQNDSKRIAMGKNAYQKVRNCFDPKKNSEKFEKLYLTLKKDRTI